MSVSKKLQKAIYQLLKQIVKLGKTITKSLINWLLRSLMVIGRNRRLRQAGFVLPTVVMVTLVVILLTTAIMIRSFDRAKNAGNVRVNERVMAAASPSIDRAQAKINALLGDPTLPRGTPTDEALGTSIAGNLAAYTLGDETPLQLTDGTNTIETAWRFPLDTDNNGLYDSYSLYGIYFASPEADEARSTLQARTQPMDQGQGTAACGVGFSTLVGSAGWYKTSDGNLRRAFFVFAATVPITQPDAANNEEAFAGSDGFAALEYQQDQARIPLTNNAVVYQDDLFIDPGAGIKLNGRIMTGGNLIIGQGGREVRLLQVSGTGSCFYTEDNGDITVGGNVMIALEDDGTQKNPINIDLFQEGAVPTINAQFANANASITNNAREGMYNDQAYAERISLLVAASLATPPAEVTDVVNDPDTNVTVEEALEDYFIQRTRRVPFVEAVDVVATTQGAPADNTLRPKDNWIYPANPATGAALNGLTLNQQQPPATDPEELEGNELELGDRMTVGNGLPADWWEPDLARFVNFYDRQPQFVAGSNNPNAVTWTGSPDEPRTRMTQVIPLDDIGDTSRSGFWERSAAEAPTQPLDGTGGLRVITGAGIYDPSIPPPATPPLSLNNTSFFSDPNNSARRLTEQTPIATLLVNPGTDVKDDLSTLENESLQDDPRTPAVVEGFTVVFPDSMAMWEDYNDDGTGDGNQDATATVDRIPTANTDRRGDLVMRATAVYHYRSGSDDPIACVSSYYNPSNNITARNNDAVDDLWAGPEGVTTEPNFLTNGLSNNGISYPASANLANTIPQATVLVGGMLDNQDPPSGIGALPQKLNYQANLIFPNGRFVNEPLRQSLLKAPGDRNLADAAAIDSTICALEIADGTLVPNNAVIPHGAIYETAFLDARQVKAIESEPLYDPATNVPNAAITSDYDLSIAERQPLEIRATVLDLELLRTTEITGASAVPAPEYLLPDSGIIYATRDDAQLDLSAPGANLPILAPITQAEADTRRANQRLNSPVDFILDPHRRPNGIMLTNGAILARQNNANLYKQEERGIILATNLPTYIKAAENPLSPGGTAGFNLHQDTAGNLLEEFTDRLTGREWTAPEFYDRIENERDDNFACRNGTPGLDCNPGDLWRSATIISDAVTLLSDNFRFGFRNEGDYDLRKNVDNLTNNLVFRGYDINGNNNIAAGDTADENQLGFDLNGNGNATDLAVPETEITVTAARRLNGFFDNNYLRSSEWFDGLGFPRDFDGVAAGIQGSSYVNNFVTPIQRRAEFSQYAMEMCLRPLVELCEPDDWFAGHDANGDGVLVAAELNDRASDLIAAAPQNELARWGAGSNAQMPLPFDLNGNGAIDAGEEEVLWHYPRRIAFRRDPANNRLDLDGGMPVPLGVDVNTVAPYPYAGNRPPAVPNALWYRTTNQTNVNPPTNPNYGTQRLFFTNQVANNLTQQPLLVPVLQLYTPEGTPRGGNILDAIGSGRAQTWMQEPTADTTFNLIMATGDNPARPNAPGGLAEQNGGMPNLPMFLENWGENRQTRLTTNIAGSFIQFRRKTFATAPFLHLLNTTATDPLFGEHLQQYTGTDSGNRSPYYAAPERAWGFDVGLLAQLPDLFSSLITTPSAGDPNEFYREVSRDDPWVQTLLCAQTFDTGTGAATGNAVSDQYRPNNCP
ncbi:MAG: hypothetical protein F6K21_11205 [Symploca sp. SIO2D2]|nr:hypothetical protein [Symploca sp. SIO2D2]